MPGTTTSRHARAARATARAGALAGVAVAALLLTVGLPAFASPLAAPGLPRATATSPIRLEAYAAPTEGALPLDVYFQANVTGGSSPGATVLWSFGDGTSGTGLSLRHLYTSSGNFTVDVAANDSAGDSASVRLHVNVSDLPAPSTSASTPSSELGPVEILVVFATGVGVGTLSVGLAAWWKRTRRSGSSGGGADPAPSPALAAPVSVVSATEAPTAEADGAPRAVSATAPRRRSSELILLHLARLGPIADDRIAERARSQHGIVEGLGLPQNVVSPILRRLEKGGALRSELRHVTGEARRLKVYELTPLGRSLAVDLRRRAAAASVEPVRARRP